MKKIAVFSIIFFSLIILLTTNINALTYDVSACGGSYPVPNAENINVLNDLTEDTPGACCIEIYIYDTGYANVNLNLKGHAIIGQDSFPVCIKSYGDYNQVTINDGTLQTINSGYSAISNLGSSYAPGLNLLLNNVTIKGDAKLLLKTEIGKNFGYLRLNNVEVLNQKLLNTTALYQANIYIYNSYISLLTTDILDGNYFKSNSVIYNSVFNTPNITTLYGYIDGNLVNNSLGNYYSFNANCTDIDTNGVCDDPLNFSFTQDTAPLRLLSKINGRFSVPEGEEPEPEEPGVNVSLINYERCPDPEDTNYLFCENFNYENDIFTEGWDYNTNLTRIFPEWYIFNSWGSLKTNDTPIFHRLEGIFNNLDYATSYGGIYRNAYNYNIDRLRFSYKTKINQSNLITYLQAESNGWADTWGIDLFNRYGMFYYTNTSNKFYIYNYSRNDFDEFISLTGENAKVDVILYKARTFLDVSYCDFFVSITDALGEHNSSIYRAGYQPKSAIPDGLLEPAIYTYCNYIGAVGFEGEYEDAGALVDDVNVYVLSRNSELKIHLTDRCIDESYYSAEFPASPLPMANKILNVSGVNYTTDGQGYLTINGLGTGFYDVYVTAFNTTNKFNLLSNSSQDFQEICFNRFSNYEPDAVGDLGNMLMDMFSNFGLKTTASKLIIFLIVIIVINVWFGIATLPAIIVIIINVICVSLGVILNLIPFWVVFLILTALIGGFLLFGLKRGED